MVGGGYGVQKDKLKTEVAGMVVKSGNMSLAPLRGAFTLEPVMNNTKPPPTDDNCKIEYQSAVAKMVVDHIESITSQGGDGIKALRDFIEAAELVRDSTVEYDVSFSNIDNHKRVIQAIISAMQKAGWAKSEIEDAVAKQAQTLLGSYSGEYPEGATENDK